jgi:hypothetical protein
LLNADHIDIVGNKIMGVGQTTGQGQKPPQRFGIQIVACLTQKITGNEITQIGPEAYTAESAGIQILAPLEHTEITDNVVRLTASSLEHSYNWIALQIKLPEDYQLEIFNDILLLLESDADGNIKLTVGDRTTTFSDDARQMTVQDNRFEVQGGLRSADIVGRGSCLFNSNRCMRNRDTFTLEPAVRIEAEAVVANANSIEVHPISNQYDNVSIAIDMQANTEDVTVLGNITCGKILIKSIDLGTPWKELNVIKP